MEGGAAVHEICEALHERFHYSLMIIPYTGGANAWF